MELIFNITVIPKNIAMNIIRMMFKIFKKNTISAQVFGIVVDNKYLISRIQTNFRVDSHDSLTLTDQKYGSNRKQFIQLEVRLTSAAKFEI